MTRYKFGQASQDWTFTVGDGNIPVLSGGVDLTMWTARTGGSQIVDLLDSGGSATDTITSGAGGTWPVGAIPEFSGPDDGTSVLWADGGAGIRYKLVATNLGALLPGTIRADDLADVNAASPSDAQVLAWDADTSRWMPSSPTLVVPADGSDISARLQARLDAVTGGPDNPRHVRVVTPGGGQVYINSTVRMATSWTRLEFDAPVRMGPLGNIRLWGGIEEVPASSLPHLQSDAVAGASTIVLASSGDLVYFSVGSVIRIRGLRDSDGDIAEGEYNTVTAINTGTKTLTLGTPLAYNYAVSYSSGAYFTQVTRITASRLSGNAARGDRTVSVSSASIFSAGDLVELSDTKLSDSGNPYHLEQAVVMAVDTGAGTITLSRPLSHAYATADLGTVSVVTPVIGSSISGAYMTWVAQGANYPIWVRYGRDCSVHDVTASSEEGESWTAHAVRTDHSYNCEIRNVRAYRPLHTAGGQGYGPALYSSTLCRVTDCHSVGCRHGVLLFHGAASNVVAGNRITDTSISAIDLHGCEETDNLITGNHITGGNSAAGDGSTLKSALKAGNATHDLGSPHNVFVGNTIVALTGTGAAFEVNVRSRDVIFRGNTVLGAGLALRLPYNTGHSAYTMDTIVVADNILADVAQMTSVNGGPSSVIGNLLVARNQIVRAVDALALAGAPAARVVGNVWTQPAITAAAAVALTSCAGAVVADNDVGASYRGVNLVTSSGVRVLNNRLMDVTDAWLQDDGSSPNLTAINNEVAVAAATAGTASSGRYITHRGAAYVQDTPADHGMVEWTGPPDGITATSATPVAGLLHIARIVARNGGTVGKVTLHIGAAGVTVANAFVGLFDASGARVAVSGDVSSTLQGSGVVRPAFTGSVTLTRGAAYYAALLVGSAGTMPQFSRGPASIAAPNAGFSAATNGLRYATYGSGQTSVPSSVTVASMVTTSALGIWMALES